MKESTSTASVSALIAGIMSIITVFGGYTAILGVIFALFGIIIGSRGKREHPTKTAIWAVRISVIGMVLCSAVSALLILLFLVSAFDFPGFDGITEKLKDSVDFGGIYRRAKELLVRFINRF